MALPPRDLRHQYLRFKGLQYTDADITDFKTRLAKIYMREPIAATAAPRGAEDALDINEGAQAVLAPIHAPPSPPPAAGRTMSQRFRRLVEEI
ncbi:hypothetical protein Tco_1403884 [Tanacetum coccineum]